MNEDDARRVPAREGRAQIRERASRFLAFSRRVGSEEEARAFVAGLSRRFHDATHVCFAWRIGEAARAADAGEPSGTAGHPILSAIDAAGLDETAVAVVRYFGGTKLGTAGLARCYGRSAREALADGGAQTVFDAEEIALLVPYERLSEVRRLVEPPHVELAGEEFGQSVRVRLRVRRSRLSSVQARLAEARLISREGEKPLPPRGG